MYELTLMINIVVALVMVFIGGIIARRLGLPTIVGYLLAGIAISPFTPGVVGDTEMISRLAELGEGEYQRVRKTIYMKGSEQCMKYLCSLTSP